jgi:hypothetical protein
MGLKRVYHHYLSIANREREFGWVFSLISWIASRLVNVFWRRLIHPSISLPLACLTVALFAPAPVRAGCDYPTHIERTAVGSADITAKRSALPNPDMPVPSKPCACTGPTCSRQPLAPSAPPSVESVKISEWGRLVPRFVFQSPQAENHPQDESLQRPSRHSSTVYHPPRLPF